MHYFRFVNIFCIYISYLFLPFMVIALLNSCKEKTILPSGDPDYGGLFLPDGIEGLVVAEGIGRARHLAINDNGDIYVKLRLSEEAGR